MGSPFSTHRWDHDGAHSWEGMPYIPVRVDGEIIRIPVKIEVYIHYQEQFIRSDPTDGYRKRFHTLKDAMQAAYRAGIEEGLRRAAGR